MKAGLRSGKLNAFGIGKSSVSTEIREVCMVITKYLGPKYIEEVETLTAGFYRANIC